MKPTRLPLQGRVERWDSLFSDDSPQFHTCVKDFQSDPGEIWRMTRSTSPKAKIPNQPESRMSPLRGNILKSSFRLNTVAILAACAFGWLGASQALAQFKFGRVANQPWSGGVTVNNQMVAPKSTPKPPDPFE